MLRLFPDLRKNCATLFCFVIFSGTQGFVYNCLISKISHILLAKNGLPHSQILVSNKLDLIYLMDIYKVRLHATSLI